MMKMPADYLLRKGDVVVVHATVKYDVSPGDSSAHIQLVAGYSGCLVALDGVQGIHALKWEIGDKVKQDAIISPQYEVIAVQVEEVWVKLKSGQTQIFKANDLRPWVETEPDRQFKPMEGPTPEPLTPILDDFQRRITRSMTVEEQQADAAAKGSI